MKYKICVAIPIKSPDLKINKQIMETALEKSPDLIEFRFDYINEAGFITHSLLKELMSIIPPKIPLIFTIRRKQEGGQYDLSINERLEVLRHLIEAKPDYLDIEINSESEVLKNIIDLAYDYKVKLIFSYHDFEKSITYEETTEILNKFNKKLSHQLSNDLSKINGWSRILCVKFGSMWTYGSLEDKTAPGQIKIEKIREIHQLLFED